MKLIFICIECNFLFTPLFLILCCQVGRDHLHQLLGGLDGLPSAEAMAGGLANSLDEAVLLMQVGPSGVTIDSSSAQDHDGSGQDRATAFNRLAGKGSLQS